MIKVELNEHRGWGYGDVICPYTSPFDLTEEESLGRAVGQI